MAVKKQPAKKASTQKQSIKRQLTRSELLQRGARQEMDRLLNEYSRKTKETISAREFEMQTVALKRTNLPLAQIAKTVAEGDQGLGTAYAQKMILAVKQIESIPDLSVKDLRAATDLIIREVVAAATNDPLLSPKGKKEVTRVAGELSAYATQRTRLSNRIKGATTGYIQRVRSNVAGQMASSENILIRGVGKLFQRKEKTDKREDAVTKARYAVSRSLQNVGYRGPEERQSAIQRLITPRDEQGRFVKRGDWADNLVKVNQDILKEVRQQRKDTGKYHKEDAEQSEQNREQAERMAESQDDRAPKLREKETTKATPDTSTNVGGKLGGMLGSFFGEAGGGLIAGLANGIAKVPVNFVKGALSLGAGIGGFMLEMAGTGAIIEKFGGAEGFEKSMNHIAAGFAAFGGHGLAGAATGAGLLAAAFIPGAGETAFVGLPSLGAGIAGFLLAVGGASWAVDKFGGGEAFEKFMGNFANGLGELSIVDGTNLAKIGAGIAGLGAGFGALFAGNLLDRFSGWMSKMTGGSGESTLGRFARELKVFDTVDGTKLSMVGKAINDLAYGFERLAKLTPEDVGKLSIIANAGRNLSSIPVPSVPAIPAPAPVAPSVLAPAPVAPSVPTQPPSPMRIPSDKFAIMREAMSGQGIVDVNVQNAMIGQAYRESNLDVGKKEVLTYTTPERIKKFFGKGLAQQGIDPASLVNNPQALAEAVYGYQSPKGKELGNKEPGDGFKYRGRGYIMLTGRGNYEKASKALNVDLVKNPDLVNDPIIGAQVLGWYTKDRGLGKLQGQDVDKILLAATKAVAGNVGGAAGKEIFEKGQAGTLMAANYQAPAQTRQAAPVQAATAQLAQSQVQAPIVMAVNAGASRPTPPPAFTPIPVPIRPRSEDEMLRALQYVNAV